MSDTTTPRDTLSEEQRAVFDAAVNFAADPPALSLKIEGQAGAGKSFLLSAIAKSIEVAGILTPTGKSSSVLRKRSGLRAQTIHSWLLDLKEIRKDAQGRREMLWNPRHAPDSMPNQIVLVDEARMLGCKLAEDLLITGVVVIMFGDTGQLPPVNDQPFFENPDCVLTEVHRQAAGSPIIRQAHRARRGLPYQPDTADFQVIRWAYDQAILNADVCLTWTNRSRQSLNAQARRLRRINEPLPQVGEPLMCLKNHRRSGVYKGAIYQLARLYDGGDSITVDVDGIERNIDRTTFDVTEESKDDDSFSTSFTFGYACTVHSAAGSEWDNVLLFDDCRDTKLYDKWIYTGITRASKRITVVRR